MGKAAAAPAGRSKTTDELDQEIKGLKQRQRELRAKLQAITGVEPDPHDGKMDGFLRKILGNLYVDSGPVAVDRAVLEAEISAIEEALPTLGEELDRQKKIALELRIKEELWPAYRELAQKLVEAIDEAERCNGKLFELERETGFHLESVRWNGLVHGVWLGEATSFLDWRESVRRFLAEN